MDYVDRLKRAGFDVQVCSHAANDVARFGLIEKESVFVTLRANHNAN